MDPRWVLCPSLRFLGFVTTQVWKAEAVVSHHLIKVIITGSGPAAKRKKAFQSLPLHFNRSPMLYNTREQGVNQLKNIVLHSMHCGLQLPNDLHLSSLAVEVYN